MLKYSLCKFLISTILVLFTTEQNNYLQSNKVLKNKLEVLLPIDFTLMDIGMLNTKYPLKAKRPTVVYTDSEGEINIAFNHTPNNASMSDIPKIHESILNQLEYAPTVTLTGSELRDINGKIFFIIKFYSQAIDTQVYNVMFGTELGGKLLMGTFNCTVNHLQEWQPIANEIINSIIILQ